LEIFKPEFERCLIEQPTRQSPDKDQLRHGSQMLDDFTRATRYEIDKAREIVFVGEKRLFFTRPKTDLDATSRQSWRETMPG